MEWYWVTAIVIVGSALYIACGVTSLWLAKKVGDNLDQEGVPLMVFYLGPIFILSYGPQYIAQRLGHVISIKDEK